MNSARLQKILARFPKQRVLVVGDVMLDIFVWGKVSRISPEAPVPVVEVTKESFYPGGAANVARNITALTGRAHILSVTGKDRDGETLRHVLDDNGIRTDALLADSHRPTTVKTRVIAQRQQVVRFDREHTEPVTPAVESRLLSHFQKLLPRVDAVIFEDYAKGLLNQNLLDEMAGLAHKKGKITAADPNPRRVLDYHNLTAITPNRLEAFTAADVPNTNPVEPVLRDKPLLTVGEKLLQKWTPQNLLITLGEHGMCLFRQGEKPHHIPTVAQEVFDVSGAGDTAIATLVLALAAGADPVEASEISNHAAGIVVGKLGTATCSVSELANSLRR